MRRTLLSCTLLLAAGQAAASTAWVSNEKDNSLSLIDMQTMQVTDTLPVGQRPRGLLLSHDNTLLYICASDSDRVQVMDVATRKIIKELPRSKDASIPTAVRLCTQIQGTYQDGRLAVSNSTPSAPVLARLMSCSCSNFTSDRISVKREAWQGMWIEGHGFLLSRSATLPSSIVLSIVRLIVRWRDYDF